jgi:hypothetical protein
MHIRLSHAAGVASAIYFMTPLSLRYVLERLMPQLADAVVGGGR